MCVCACVRACACVLPTCGGDTRGLPARGLPDCGAWSALRLRHVADCCPLRHRPRWSRSGPSSLCCLSSSSVSSACSFKTRPVGALPPAPFRQTGGQADLLCLVPDRPVVLFGALARVRKNNPKVLDRHHAVRCGGDQAASLTPRKRLTANCNGVALTHLLLRGSFPFRKSTNTMTAPAATSASAWPVPSNTPSLLRPQACGVSSFSRAARTRATRENDLGNAATMKNALATISFLLYA